MPGESERAWDEALDMFRLPPRLCWGEEILGFEGDSGYFPDYASGDRCPYCGGPVHRVNATLVYGKDGEAYGQLYVCSFYPKCDAYVGVHKGTNRPKGTLANPALRLARRLAHEAFDATWKGKHRSVRSRAYAKLARQLKLDGSECHIGLFTLEQCARVVQLYRQKPPTGKMIL
jgi:hypothetical protein